MLKPQAPITKQSARGLAGLLPSARIAELDDSYTLFPSTSHFPPRLASKARPGHPRVHPRTRQPARRGHTGTISQDTEIIR
jgi:hypothetical protein